MTNVHIKISQVHFLKMYSAVSEKNKKHKMYKTAMTVFSYVVKEKKLSREKKTIV